MDDKLRATLDKVVRLTQQDAEFGAELRKALGIEPSANSASNNISKDVSEIRAALQIKASNSCDYSFIRSQRLRDQLTIDNLRMENAAIGLQQNERERFYTFCVNAFYQIENIINYYFHFAYPKIDDLLDAIEQATAQEKEDYRFKRNGREMTVADVVMNHKINAFCNMVFPGDNIKFFLTQLRRVRNEGEHRCMTIQNDVNSKDILHKFFQYNTFNTVRVQLKKTVSIVEILLKTM